MKRLVVLLFFFCKTSISFAQKIDNIFIETVRNTYTGALNYLIKSQSDSTIGQQQYKGEWHTTMELTEPYFFIGQKQKVKDSNGFTVAAIHNFISEIYLSDTTQIFLKPCLNKAFGEIQSYRNQDKFNFWKALPPNRDLRFGREPNPLPLVRRPTQYRLKSRFINNAANVPEDADDTSLGNLASLYHNQIFEDSIKIIECTNYDEFLDKNRENVNWYNHLFAPKPNSGAYLTWLHTEHQFRVLKVFRSFLNTFLIFIPGSTARPKAYKPWIPFGANDVDVVVNTNVLTYLKLSNQLNKSAGKEGSINYINWFLKRDKWQNNAVYYPNLFHVHYGVARAYASGIEQLKSSSEIVYQDLLNLQQADGSFESQDWLNNKDLIQSTAYALHAMLDLKNAGFNVPDKNINLAVIFLMSKANINNTGVSWEGGVFFSGGTALRNILVWKSDAYTTALIANSLCKYLKLKKGV